MIRENDVSFVLASHNYKNYLLASRDFENWVCSVSRSSENISMVSKAMLKCPSLKIGDAFGFIEKNDETWFVAWGRSEGYFKKPKAAFHVMDVGRANAVSRHQISNTFNFDRAFRQDIEYYRLKGEKVFKICQKNKKPTISYRSYSRGMMPFRYSLQDAFKDAAALS